MFAFEIVRLPGFEYRNLPCNATSGGTIRSPSMSLVYEFGVMPVRNTVPASKIGTKLFALG